MTNGGGHAPPPRHAPVMELVDMRDLGSRAETRVGSSPFRRTKTRPLLPKRGWGFVLFSALPPQRRRGPVPLCLGAKERRLRSFENRRSQSGHDHGPPHDGYFSFAAVRQFLSIRSARAPGMPIEEIETYGAVSVKKLSKQKGHRCRRPTRYFRSSSSSTVSMTSSSAAARASLSSGRSPWN